jgi:hypothetical protein
VPEMLVSALVLPNRRSTPTTQTSAKSGALFCQAALPEERDEVAAVHSMTSSARASSVIGKVRPSCGLEIKNKLDLHCLLDRA